MNRSRNPRRRGIAFTAATAGALTLIGGVVAGPVSATSDALPVCAPWTATRLATGLGTAENVVSDGYGAMTVSVTDQNRLKRVTPDGKVTTIAENVPAAGGLARQGRWTYVTTGLKFESAFAGIPDGAIQRIDVRTGERQTWATNLVSPNGLAFLPNGDAVTTRPVSAFGVLSAVTRVPANQRNAPERFWSDLAGTNGAAVDPSGRWLYVSRSLNLSQRAEIWRIDILTPARREKVADLGVGVSEMLDDLTVTANGTVVVAAWGSGRVYSVDPRTGAKCVIASGLPKVSSVEAGAGLGFDPAHLYVTSFDGILYDLAPPARP